MAITAVGTLVGVQSLIAERLLLPWQFATGVETASNYWGNLANLFLDRNFWYTFVWLLPLGVWRLRALPGPWVRATAAAIVIGALLSAWVPPAGLVGRVTFDVAGPLLGLSAAMFLCAEKGEA